MNTEAALIWLCVGIGILVMALTQITLIRKDNSTNIDREVLVFRILFSAAGIMPLVLFRLFGSSFFTIFNRAFVRSDLSSSYVLTTLVSASLVGSLFGFIVVRALQRPSFRSVLLACFLNSLVLSLNLVSVGNTLAVPPGPGEEGAQARYLYHARLKEYVQETSWNVSRYDYENKALGHAVDLIGLLRERDLCDRSRETRRLRQDIEIASETAQEMKEKLDKASGLLKSYLSDLDTLVGTDAFVRQELDLEAERSQSLLVPNLFFMFFATFSAGLEYSGLKRSSA